MGYRGTRYEVQAGDKDRTPFEKVQKLFEMIGLEGYDGHDAILAKLMTLESVSVSPTVSNPHYNTTVFSLTIPQSLCNMAGVLHGGAVALIFDICTSSAIAAASKEGFWDSGHVSRTLNCTYLRPVIEGQKVIVESEVVHLGKKMGLTRALIKTEDGKVCYTCEHGKAALGGSSL